MKQAILVLGMHRSGTSALCGTLNIFGAYVGDNLLTPTDDNKKGYFESFEIVRCNDYILQEKLDTSWHDINDIPIYHPDIFPILEYVIKTTFNNESIIAIKDPRICLLLPLYKKVLLKLGYVIHYVRTYRDESEIVKSLMIGRELSEEKSKKIIKRYNDSLDNSLPYNHIVVEFEKLLVETDDTIYKIQQYLPFLNYSDEKKILVKEFITPSLKHY